MALARVRFYVGFWKSDGLWKQSCLRSALELETRSITQAGSVEVILWKRSLGRRALEPSVPVCGFNRD